MPSVPDIEYRNSQRSDGGPWAALHFLGPGGEPVDSVEEAVCVQVFYSDYSSIEGLPEGMDSWIAIMEICAEQITIYPVGQRYGLPSYGQPLFEHVRRITIGRYSDLALPGTVEELDQLLEILPAGFYKNWRHGLGVLWNYRVIITAIEAAEPVEHIVFHGPMSAGNHRVLIAPHAYALSMGVFDELMRGVRSITSRHQRAARKEKLALCHNTLMHGVDADRYPRRRLAIAADVLSELTDISRGALLLSKRDQRAIVALARQNAREFARSEPAELLRLRDDIEVISLLQLIERCQGLIASSATERTWQAFFKSNPFVLTMAFHFPIFLISEQPYVGGKAVQGTGGKYGDFLVSAASTGSLALIEIKEPATKLFGKAYRNGVYPPSPELSGAVAQVLVQRDTFKESFLLVGKELSRDGHSAYSLTCLVIAGTTPKAQEEKEAFERYRNSLHGVIVLTFDELVERLLSLHSLLTERPQVPAAPPGDSAPWESPMRGDVVVEGSPLLG